jgi:hypothetical protein
MQYVVFAASGLDCVVVATSGDERARPYLVSTSRLRDLLDDLDASDGLVGEHTVSRRPAAGERARLHASPPSAGGAAP